MDLLAYCIILFDIRFDLQILLLFDLVLIASNILVVRFLFVNAPKLHMSIYDNYSKIFDHPKVIENMSVVFVDVILTTANFKVNKF